MKAFIVLAVLVAAAHAESEAEADPYLLAAAPYAYGGYAAPYAYGGYAAPAVAYAGVLPAVKPCTNAMGIAVPCAHGAYAHALGKRSADSEADPAYFAVPTALGYAGYPYAGYAAPYAAGAALIHTSRLGVCLNYLGAQVPC